MSLFDIFKKKTDQETLEEIIAQSSSSGTTLDPKQLMQQQSTLTGSGQLIPGLYPTPPGLLSSSQVQQALASFIQGLSKEEQNELEQLRKDHANQVKAAKLGIFKKLPGEIRQLVVNAYEWKICFDNMNATTVIKDPRLAELERKDENAQIFKTAHTGHSHGVPRGMATQPFYSSGLFFGSNFDLPEGLSLEDLKLAHMEASLEEEMLNNGQS